MYGTCPTCGYQCWMERGRGNEPYLVGCVNQHVADTDFGPSQEWTEIWQCPECGSVFTEPNGEL